MFRISKSVLVLIAVLSPVFSGVINRKKGCSVSINEDLGKPQALVLQPGQFTDSNAFYWPHDEDKIDFMDSQVVVLACPGGTLLVQGSSTRLESAQATCTAGSFNIRNKTVKFDEISCSKVPQYTARYSGETCLGDKREIEIGFDLADGRFIEGMLICFDDVMQNTLYSVFDMSRGIEGFEFDFPRPNFVQGNFHQLGSQSLEKLYKRKGQKATLNALLGLPASSTKYISDTNNYFLSRGHMGAKADFVYGALQRMTFHYVNIAPQWQTFNGANWNSLEQDIREYVGEISNTDFRIYTGTHGVATLPHEKTGEDTELYLYVNGNKRGIPVPQVVWKILYEPSSKQAVAFVGVNNPYHEDVSDYIFCEDICDRYTWLSWKKPKDIVRGYSYCCDVNELRKTISNIPDFQVDSILINPVK